MYDAPEVVHRKVRRLAKYVRNSKHMIAFTGAGVSTAAGVPDFRSGVNTSLKTGAGAWVLRDSTPEVRKANAAKRITTSTTKAVPTTTHMSLVKLHDGGQGPLKLLVSQNTDGLHRRSGMPPDALAELHGNSNLERCVECGWEVMRDYKTRNHKTAPTAKQHRTGRKCALCGGDLHDTIINFGESLPVRDLTMACDHAERADLCLALGSSLGVSPANHIPERVGVNQGGRLVIVNLMRTHLDEQADLVIHAQCNTVMELLMKELALDIPTFKLHRRFQIGADFDAPPVVGSSGAAEEGHLRVWVQGLSPSASGSGADVPFQFIRRLVVTEVRAAFKEEGNATKSKGAGAGVLGGWSAVSGTRHTQPKGLYNLPRPYSEVLQEHIEAGDGVNEGVLEVRLTHPAPAVTPATPLYRVRVKLHFFRNYNEPPLELVLNAGEVRQYDVSFEPMGRAAQGTADSSASDTDGRARDPDQVQSPTNGAARDAADGREWVHERVDDVHEDTDGLMAELTRLAEDLNGEV